jgi:hypothetical protein
VTDRLQKLDDELATRANAGALRDEAKHLATEVQTFRGRRGDTLDAAAGVLNALAIDLENADRAPTQPQREVFETYRKRLDPAIEKWRALAAGPLRDLDRKVRAAGLAPVVP